MRCERNPAFLTHTRTHAHALLAAELAEDDGAFHAVLDARGIKSQEQSEFLHELVEIAVAAMRYAQKLGGAPPADILQEQSDAFSRMIAQNAAWKARRSRTRCNCTPRCPLVPVTFKAMTAGCEHGPPREFPLPAALPAALPRCLLNAVGA